MSKRKAISPVVATALLLVVAVVAVVGFQGWFQQYSSSLFGEAESQSSSGLSVTLNKIIGEEIFLRNSGDTEFEVSSIVVDGEDCNVDTTNISGSSSESIDISSCLRGKSGEADVVVETSTGLIQKTFFLSDTPASLSELQNLSVTVPADAIVAYRSESCPAGWSRFDAANGRVLVGTGSGVGLSTYSLGDTGGEDFVTLNASQIPVHSHDIQATQVGGNTAVPTTETLIAVPNIGGGTGGNWYNDSSDYSHDLVSTGGDASHENRMPYVKYTYCISDSASSALYTESVTGYEGGSCPADWNPHSETDGKVIMGTETPNQLFEEGGENNVSLSSSHLPSHTHSYSTSDNNGTTAIPVGMNFARMVLEGIGYANTYHSPDENVLSLGQETVTSFGNSSPHENRMPYVTKEFCTPSSSANSLPSGTILGFNLSSCPSGWSSAVNISSRVVVDTGGPNGYGLNSMGGQETVTLSQEELVQHTHGFPATTSLADLVVPSGNRVLAEPYYNDSLIMNLYHDNPPQGSLATMSTTSSVGGGGSHENRMPYVAVTFCEKD